MPFGRSVSKGGAMECDGLLRELAAVISARPTSATPPHTATTTSATATAAAAAAAAAASCYPCRSGGRASPVRFFFRSCEISSEDPISDAEI